MPAITTSAAAPAATARPRAAAAGSTPSAILGSPTTAQNLSSSSSGLIIRTPSTNSALDASSCTSPTTARAPVDTRTPQMRDAGLCSTTVPSDAPPSESKAAPGGATSGGAALARLWLAGGAAAAFSAGIVDTGLSNVSAESSSPSNPASRKSPTPFEAPSPCSSPPRPIFCYFDRECSRGSTNRCSERPPPDARGAAVDGFPNDGTDAFS